MKDKDTISLPLLLKHAAVIVLVLLAVAPMPGSDALCNPEIDKIAKERKQLEKDIVSLQKQLKEFQVKLKQTKEEEKQSLEALKNYNAQIKVLEKMIAKNNSRVQAQNREIKLLKKQYAENQSSYQRIVDEFRGIVVNVYKAGSKQPVELLFASSSLNQAVVRSRYIDLYSKAVIRRVDNLQQAAKELEKSRTELEKSRQRRSDVLREQEGRKRNFSEKKKEKQIALSTLKKDEKKFAGEIKANQKKLQKLQKKIEELIRAEQAAIEKERERQRLEQERRRKAGLAALADSSEAALALLSTDFKRALGKLPWPVDNGVIVRKFGKITDPDLNIVTTNNGVDISVSTGSPVRAVSGGKIAQIAYLPTYGNIVIIRHAQSFLTVYANLSKINVAKNDIVAGKEIIGVAGSMPEGGSLVHFEIWKGKVKQDPQRWLTK